MSKIKNGGLDQYGAEPFEQQQFGTAGVGVVKVLWQWLRNCNICTRHFLDSVMFSQQQR